MTTLAVLSPSETGPFVLPHPHPGLRFALNENNGTYWVPGQRGRWEVAPTPFACLSTATAFTLDPAPPRLCQLAAHAYQVQNDQLEPHGIRPESLAERGATTTPWPHQVRTLEWLLAQTTAQNAGALLYLGMGTGKTRIVLDWLRLKHIPRTLVVAPKSVLPAWASEAARHYGDTFSVWVAGEGSQARRPDLIRSFLDRTTKPALVVLNYDIVWRPEYARLIETANFTACICDEGHRLKGRSSRRSLYFRTAWKRHPYRIALTGTPLSNGVLSDAFGLYAFLDPGIYGQSITRFEDRYAVKDRRSQWLVLGWRNTEDFYRRFWWVARHEDRSVLSLPPVTDTLRRIDLSAEARRLYATMRDELIVSIRDGTVTAANAGVALSKLQQMANGSVIDASGLPLRVHDQKRLALEEVLQETGEEPVVVFALFRADLTAVHDACANVGLQSLELSGSRNELARWQQGEATVLAVQIQSGSEGISLVRASIGVFFSPSHALSQMEQARARLSRPGQENPTTFLHLIAQSTVDTQITSALTRKRNFIEELLESRGEALTDSTRRSHLDNNIEI